MEELPHGQIDLAEKTLSLKPSNRDEDDHNTVSTLNDSTLDHGDLSGNFSTNDDLPLVQRVESTLSDSFLEESLSVSFCGHVTSPLRLQPEPWHSMATQAILQKLHTEYQRQRIRLGELRSRNDLGLAGTNWKRNLYTKDFKYRILLRRIADLQAKNQELMKRQGNQGVLEQKLEAAQRQVKILQSAWNQTLDLHMAELDLSDDVSCWQPRFTPPRRHAARSGQAHVQHLAHPPSTNSATAPQVIEISQIWKQDATATAIPIASQVSEDSSLELPREGRYVAKNLEEPGSEQQEQSKAPTEPLVPSQDSSCEIPAVPQDTSHGIAINKQDQEHEEKEDRTAQLQAEITSLQAASTAQQVEMAKISDEFLQDKARHERQYANLETKHHLALSHIQQLQQENVKLVKDKQLMQASLSQYQSSISTLCKKQSTLFLELEEKATRIDQAGHEIARLHAVVEQQEQESLGLQDQVYTQQQELMEVVTLKESNEKLTTQCQGLENSLHQSSQQVSHLESMLIQLQAKLQEAEKSQFRLQTANDRLTRECQENKRKHQLKTEKSNDADYISEVHASIFGFW